MQYQFTYISESTKTRNNYNPALEKISKDKKYKLRFLSVFDATHVRIWHVA